MFYVSLLFSIVAVISLVVLIHQLVLFIGSDYKREFNEKKLDISAFILFISMIIIIYCTDKI